MRTSQEVFHTLIRSMAEMKCIRQLLLVAMYDVNLKVVILRFQILALLTLNRVNPNNESLLTQIGFHDLTLNANTGLVINDFQNLNVGNSGGGTTHFRLNNASLVFNGDLATSIFSGFKNSFILLDSSTFSWSGNKFTMQGQLQTS